jgi:hypothetical protein
MPAPKNFNDLHAALHLLLKMQSEFKDIIREYVFYLSIKGYSKGSIRHYQNAIEHFFN